MMCLPIRHWLIPTLEVAGSQTWAAKRKRQARAAAAQGDCYQPQVLLSQRLWRFYCCGYIRSLRSFLAGLGILSGSELARLPTRAALPEISALQESC